MNYDNHNFIISVIISQRASDKTIIPVKKQSNISITKTAKKLTILYACLTAHENELLTQNH